MITWGMQVEQFIKDADLIHQGIQLSKTLSKEANLDAVERGVSESESFRNFLDYIGDGSVHASICSLREHVVSLAKRYPLGCLFLGSVNELKSDAQLLVH